ncbi:MAG: hypothetical protein JO171_08750 [Paludibacterium sp.]|uniref:hypothetical protein n=1 Tax=Paludibacterium sp. TaxID=1917523 RepID=UPI0025EF35DF|nr:hypothetical protein [Paludibacterium sp.]MBV8047227.1 hypothetical protein [Paludibacterium sp.]MBV8647740.1 hypothetical protein [Paludibacterium sp.]
MHLVNRFLIVMGLLLAPAVALASNTPACTYDGTGAVINTAQCATTPQAFDVLIYQLGLCTQNPTSGGSLDTRSCTMLINSAGTSADLSAGASVVLSDQAIPPQGTYGYALLVASNSIAVTNSVHYSQPMVGSAGGTGNWCWTVSGVVKEVSPSPALVACGSAPNPQPTVNKLDSFSNGCSCDPSSTGLSSDFHGQTGVAAVAGGTMQATLATNNNSFATAADFPDNITRVIAVETFANPVVINANTLGLKLQFTVSNASVPAQNGGNGQGFGARVYAYEVSAFSVLMSTY